MNQQQTTTFVPNTRDIVSIPYELTKLLKRHRIIAYEYVIMHEFNAVISDADTEIGTESDAYALTIRFNPISVVNFYRREFAPMLRDVNSAASKIYFDNGAVVAEGLYMIIVRKRQPDNHVNPYNNPAGQNSLGGVPTADAHVPTNSPSQQPIVRMKAAKFTFRTLEQLMNDNVIEKWIKKNLDDYATHDDESLEDFQWSTVDQVASEDAYIDIYTRAESHNCTRHYHLYFDKDGKPCDMADVSTDYCAGCLRDHDDHYPPRPI